MKNVVTIGGGTGSYRVLSGIKNIPNISISAIVSMADDGGSTGILRRELGVHPMGDVRQCLAALSADRDMHDFLKYRRSDGHVAGNLFLADLEKSAGSFEKGLDIAMKVLQIEGTVIPSTLDNAEVGVLLVTGTKIEGESKINDSKIKITDVEKIYYKDKTRQNPKAREAIKNADYLIICPGDFYTSIVTNLIVEGFKESLGASKAKIVAIEDLENSDTSQYKTKLEWYLGKSIDTLVKKDKSFIGEEVIEKESGDALKRSTVRHDSKKLADYLEKILI